MEHLINQDTIHLSTTNIHNPNINNKIQISNHSTIINMIKDPRDFEIDPYQI